MRTEEEIELEIETAQTALMPTLVSSSSSAIFKKWRKIIAAILYTFESIVDKDRKNLEAQTERRRYGTLAWYAAESLNFQYGDPLTFNSNTGQHYYAVAPSGNNIVVKASVFEDTSGLIIKVAKEVNSELVQLDSIELIAFKNYIEEIKVAGTDIDVISLPSDVVNIQAEVFYDGNLLVSDVQSWIEQALETYQLNAPFSGSILKNAIIDSIREIPGIDDVQFNTLTGQSFGNSPVNIVREYYTTSGYFIYSNNMLASWTFTPRYQ